MVVVVVLFCSSEYSTEEEGGKGIRVLLGKEDCI